MKKGGPLSYLLTALFALLVYLFALPTLDCFFSYIQAIITRSITQVKHLIAQDEDETKDIMDRVNGDQPLQAIGFVSNDYEVEYDDKD